MHSILTSNVRFITVTLSYRRLGNDDVFEAFSFFIQKNYEESKDEDDDT